MSPGLQDWDATTYHASPAISRGAILRAAQSIAMFKAYEDGEIAEPESSAMQLGVLAHMAVLEPRKYDSECIVAPPMDRRRVNGLDVDGFFMRDGVYVMGKVLAAEWTERFSHLTLVDAGTAKLVNGMRAAIERHAAAHHLLTVGDNEQAATFVDEESGLLCKYLMDGHYHPAKGGVVDLKSCRDPSPAGFNRMAQQHMLHVQDAHYTGGESERLGVPWYEIPPMVFVAVRNTWPHEVAMYTLPEPERVAGRDICRSALDLIAERRESGEWVPEWSLSPECDAIQLPSWPNWALRNPLRPDDV